MDHNQYIRDNFSTIWPVHLAAFTKLLIQLRHRFDGDLDLVLVLAIIGSQIRQEKWKSKLASVQKLTNGEDVNDRQYPINIHSVAAYSGIPRETVRRKVNILQKKGWVTRDADGRLAVSRSVAEELADETEHTISYLVALRIAFDAKSESQ